MTGSRKSRGVCALCSTEKDDLTHFGSGNAYVCRQCVDPGSGRLSCAVAVMAVTFAVGFYLGMRTWFIF